MKLFFVLSMLLWRCVSGVAQTDHVVVTVDELIQEALKNNPELRAFDANRSAAHARIPQMSSLDNPQFNFEIMEAPRSNVFNTSQWKYVNFELMQMFPFPGKLAKSKTLAEIDAEHAHHDYQEKELEIIEKVKAGYFELYFIQRALEVNLENIGLMNQFVNIAKIRYAVGQGMNQDVLKANVELAKLANEQITLRQQEETAKAMLNSLLNRPPQAPLGLTVLPARIVKPFDLEELQSLAIATRPMVRHDSLGVVQSRVANSLAQRQYWPDFNVSLEYVTSPLDGFRGWTTMAGISLPFAPWSVKRQRGMVEETVADIGMKEAMLNNTKNMILFAVKDALVKVQTQQRLIDLYRSTVLPQAEQSLQATIAAYQTQQTDFLSLLDSYRMLQMFKLEYYEATAMYEMGLAELERAVGKKLD
jgi:outer membrane protein TolC